jgi:cell wall-associated NlpC family hydrolase
MNNPVNSNQSAAAAVLQPAPAKPYFDSPQKFAALSRAAAGWLGTRFALHAHVQGAGVDCVHLCAAIYRAAGVMDEFRPPPYSLDGGRHLGRSMITQWLEESGRFQQVKFQISNFKFEITGPGDLLLFNTGRVEHHCGIILTAQTFVHAIARYGVIMSVLTDPTHFAALKTVWRPIIPNHP